MAIYYWVNSGDRLGWSETSGGPIVQGADSTENDDVIYDANSGSLIQPYSALFARNFTIATGTTGPY